MNVSRQFSRIPSLSGFPCLPGGSWIHPILPIDRHIHACMNPPQRSSGRSCRTAEFPGRGMQRHRTGTGIPVTARRQEISSPFKNILRRSGITEEKFSLIAVFIQNSCQYSAVCPREDPCTGTGFSCRPPRPGSFPGPGEAILREGICPAAFGRITGYNPAGR